jgi:phosphoribosylformylglycinamidine synthase
VKLRVESTSTAWTSDYSVGQEIVIPIKNGEGKFTADEKVLDELEAEGRVIARYLDNPNGSARDIAGISNAAGNVVGLMPHPEHAIEELTGPYPGPATDGLPFFTSVLKQLVNA